MLIDQLVIVLMTYRMDVNRSIIVLITNRMKINPSIIGFILTMMVAELWSASFESINENVRSLEVVVKEGHIE